MCFNDPVEVRRTKKTHSGRTTTTRLEAIPLEHVASQTVRGRRHASTSLRQREEGPSDGRRSVEAFPSTVQEADDTLETLSSPEPIRISPSAEFRRQRPAARRVPLPTNRQPYAAVPIQQRPSRREPIPPEPAYITPIFEAPEPRATGRRPSYERERHTRPILRPQPQPQHQCHQAPPPNTRLADPYPPPRSPTIEPIFPSEAEAEAGPEPEPQLQPRHRPQDIPPLSHRHKGHSSDSDSESDDEVEIRTRSSQSHSSHSQSRPGTALTRSSRTYSHSRRHSGRSSDSWRNGRRVHWEEE